MRGVEGKGGAKSQKNRCENTEQHFPYYSEAMSRSDANVLASPPRHLQCPMGALSLCGVLMSVRLLYEMVGRPGTGELHPALLELLSRRGVFVLITLHCLVIDQVRNIQKHLAGVHAFAGNLLGQRKEHAMHLHGERAGFGLAFPLAACALAQADQVLLANCHVSSRISRAGVVDENFKVHLGLASETLHVGLKLTLVGSNGAPQSVIILEGRAEAKRKDGRVLKAIGNHSGMVPCRLLIHSLRIFCIVLGHDDGQITGRKEKGLISEEAGYSG